MGGGGSSDVAEVETPVEATGQDFQVSPQQQVEVPFQHLSSGYHYPIWRVHKYNGIELKQVPISLVNTQHLQQLHTQVPYTQQQQRHQFQQFQPNQGQPQHFQPGAAQQNGQQFAMPNCKAKAPSAPIPPELQELADQFGIKDASKLPSLEDAMGLLGTTSRAETIQTIKELAATPDGMDLIRQFLASDEGAAAGANPNADSQCNDAASTQQFFAQQPNNAIVPNRQMSFGSPNLIPHQQYAVPNPYPPKQREVYGLPNAHEAVSFQSQGPYPPSTNIMSLIKSEAVPHEEYGVPNELSTAHSEHQGYNYPKPNVGESSLGQHETYGLPNMKPAVAFQQGYYAPRSNKVEHAKIEQIPHKEYNVPNEDSSSDHDTQEPHQEYGVPNSGESHASEQSVQQHYLPPQHEVYGLPNVQEAVDFHQEPHQEYGVPNNEESHASEQSAQQHEVYGLPNSQEAVNFHHGHYPPNTDSSESVKNEAIVPHQEYNVPNEDNHSDHETQVPHEVYGVPSDYQVLPNVENNLQFGHPHQAYSIPEQTVDEQGGNTLMSHQTYGVPKHDSDHNENVQQDQQDVSVPHHEYAVPSGVESQASNTQFNVPHESYALPHQRFFEPPNTFRQPHFQNNQYGAPTRTNTNNIRTHIPILQQIDGTLDRTHTNLQLGQLLTTTLRPEAGFLERVGAWTKYFAPLGPTVPIVPPQVTEDVNESVDHPQNAYTIPIPKIPELNEPHLYGLPTAPQLPNVHIPKKFALPPTSNQGPFVRVQYPLSGFKSSSDINEYSLPHQQPEPFDGQTVEEFVPDISQLPLDQRYLGNDLRTSYGTPTHPHSYAGDSSPAASETNEQHVAVLLPNRSGKFGNRNDNGDIVENEVVDEEPIKKYGPQRISSYDSYATGKLNRANDDAIIQLIPTQKPSLYSHQGRRTRQVEESSIIDAIATMTSGFRPII